MIQQIQLNEHAPLDRLNTLRLPCKARFVAEVYSIRALSNILQSVTAKRLPRLILGGGSNLLLPNTLNALVIRPMLKGIRLLRTDGDRVIIEVMAGEPWHQLVMETIAQGWFGLENLALIPGTVGAAPVQNIGAYGVEIVDRLYSVQAMDRSGQLHDLRPEECQFAYRDSLFKQQDGEWVIVSVRFALSKKPQLVLGYGDVIQAAGEHPTPLSVANAIIHIRSQKLPDPAKIANAGSFFKNPCVSKNQFECLKAEWPQISGYPQADGQVKLAAGWLIDQVGWKGRRLGGITGRVGMYEKQALVLVNYGGATSQDVLALSEAVQADVWSRFSVRLEREPVVPIGAYDESA
ncbi:UDP-N-acetylmuramate dehydrogenase [Aquirhabdus sp.]|uniref:UDP-N-acetylmuramate dehydrogenase n=1 Tax=Aquirhabdus sp. TaxID=2824160 RepID=UPI00396C571E